MELTTSWKEEGIEQGLAKGREEGRQATARLIQRLLGRRLGELPPPIRDRVQSLSRPDLEALGEALLDFQAPHELDRWLATRHSA